MMHDKIWRKSTRSQAVQNCVELSSTLDEVRDSKNCDGPTLQVDVRTLLSSIKANRLKRGDG
jgi:hypothetical protein